MTMPDSSRKHLTPHPLFAGLDLISSAVILVGVMWGNCAAALAKARNPPTRVGGYAVIV